MPFKLALLGLWHPHADGMLRQLAAHPDEFTLQGVWDPDPQVVARHAARWEGVLPGFRVCGSVAELLRQPLDGVLVEGRVADNVPTARAALERGLPVLLEKPAGGNLRDFEALATLARGRGLHLQLAYLFRWMVAVQELLRRHRTGRLGQVYLFRGRLPKDLVLYDQLVHELGEFRGGVFFEMAGHLVDLAITLCGPPRRVTPFLHHHHASGPADYVDNGLAVLEFAGGLGEIDITQLEVAPHSRRIEAFGTLGSVVIPHLGSGHLANQPVQAVEVHEAGAPEWTTLSPVAQPLQISDLREFAAVVAGRKAPDFSLDHDLLVQETLLRASDML